MLPSFQSFSFREPISHDLFDDDLFEIVKKENNNDTSLSAVGVHPNIYFPCQFILFGLVITKPVI